MITTIINFRKITENNKEPLYMSKPSSTGLDFIIFRDTNDGKMQIEKGNTSGESKISFSNISAWDEKVRHSKTRGYKVVSNLDVKHVGTTSQNAITDPNPNSGSGLSVSSNSDYGNKTFNKLAKHDSHKVGLVLNDYVQVQVDGTFKVLSVDLIDQYKNHLKELEQCITSNDMIGYNRILVKMNRIIKRKGSLSDNLVKSPSDMNSNLQLQKDILNSYLEMSTDDFDKLETKTIKDKIADSVLLTKINDSSQIILEDITETDKKLILKLLSKNNEEWRFIDAVKVTNSETQKLFNEELNRSKNKETKLLFHGSKVRNWLSIIKSGLKKSKAGSNAGTLFGNGVYFADIADKSLGYVDGGRWDNSSSIDVAYLAIYEVHIGNYADYDNLPQRNGYSTIGSSTLPNYIIDNGYDSYWAKSRNYHSSGIDKSYSLHRDEYITYNDDKSTIKYLVEVKK